MSDLSCLTYDLNTRRPKLTNFYDYYLGTETLTFIGDKLQSAFGEKLKGLVANRCNVVIDSTVDRLNVAGFEDQVGGAADQDAEAFWRTHNLGRVARKAHQDALIYGDGYVMVWPTQDGVQVVAQEPEQIAVRYDDEDPDTIAVAAKTWQLRDGRWRLNLLYPDRLKKYVSNGPDARIPETEDAWAPYQDPGDLAWPITYPWNRVPLFHLRAAHRCGYGHSDLAAIIPLQDRLNLSLANQAIAEEFQAFRQRWATGIQPTKDPETGEYISPFSKGAGEVWVSGSTDVKFGDFAPADLAMFETVIEGHERRIARTARIPMHYLIQTGTPPSGEALKTAEAPFVAKITARQEAFGDTWAELMAFALVLVDGTQAQLETKWDSAESRDETAELDRALVKKQLGVSGPQLLRELGYSDQQIAQFQDENAEAARAQQARFDEGIVAA